MTQNAWIAGVGMTRFGKYIDRGQTSLALDPRADAAGAGTTRSLLMGIYAAGEPSVAESEASRVYECAGIAQFVELAEQLRGEAGARQVEGARFAPERTGYERRQRQARDGSRT